MRLLAAHEEEIASTRIMPRDRPTPPAIAKSHLAVVGTFPPRDGSGSIGPGAGAEDIMAAKQGAEGSPSSPRKRTTVHDGPSKTNRKRSKSSSPSPSLPGEPRIESGQGFRQGDDYSRSPSHLAGLLGRHLPERSILGLSPVGLRHAMLSVRQSGLRESPLDGLSLLGHQAALSAEVLRQQQQQQHQHHHQQQQHQHHHHQQQHQQQQPLQLYSMGGGANLFCAPSSLQVGLGYGPMEFPSLHPLQYVPGPAYPDMLRSLSGIDAMGRDSTFPIGGTNRTMFLDEAARFTLPASSGIDMHMQRSWPTQHPLSVYATQSGRAPSGLMAGPIGMRSDVRMDRRTSLESAMEADRFTMDPPDDRGESLPRKNYFTPSDEPTQTSVETHSPPSSSATSFSGELLLRRDAAQAVTGTAQNFISSTFIRNPVPLGIDEDVNWLSEFHCFVRRELVEVFRADRSDCKVRNFNVAHEQVGIRCKFCAHRTSRARALRSAAYPSSIAQIYQSFTMMLRDHFPNCDALPREARIKFMTFREIPAQGATDSKRYWVYAARKVGMVDSSSGIKIDDSVFTSKVEMPPFGTPVDEDATEIASKNLLLADERDRHVASDFLILLMQQARVVQLMSNERLGSRRNLPKNLVGFACRYCCEKRRLGQCRMFPSRRRALPGKVSDLYDHLQRCFLCPANLKQELAARRDAYAVDPEGDDLFFDRVWRRLGHDS